MPKKKTPETSPVTQAPTPTSRIRFKDLRVGRHDRLGDAIEPGVYAVEAGARKVAIQIVEAGLAEFLPGEEKPAPPPEPITLDS